MNVQQNFSCTENMADIPRQASQALGIKKSVWDRHNLVSVIAAKLLRCGQRGVRKSKMSACMQGESGVNLETPFSAVVYSL